jgi:hypothetical protein
LDQFLQRWGRHASLSYTIVEPDADTNFLLDYISQYRLIPFIRLGVALPMLGRANRYVPLERYTDVAQCVMGLAEQATQKGMSAGMDCGFVACMFKVREIGQLLRWGMTPNFSCCPIFDLGPGLEAWHCFPLSQMGRVKLRECGSVMEARKTLGRMADRMRERFGAGVYERCRDCSYRRSGQCQGGCLSLIAPGHTDLTDLLITES